LRVALSDLDIEAGLLKDAGRERLVESTVLGFSEPIG